MYSRIGAIALSILSVAVPSAHGSTGNPKQEKHPKPEVQAIGPMLEASSYSDMTNLYIYIATLEEQQRQVDAYLAALEAQRIANQRTQAPRPQVTSTGSGDCAAVAAIVGWGTVNRESGGNPLAENGIYKGCAQIGIPWWNGKCSGLDWTNPSDQATCAQIVMDSQGPSAWAGTYSQ